MNGGYKFELLSKENVLDVLKDGELKGVTYYPHFRINYCEGVTEYTAKADDIHNNIINNDVVNSSVFCVEVGSYDLDFDYDLVNLEVTNSDDHLDVFVTVNEKCDPKTKDLRPNITFNKADGNNIVRGEDTGNNPLLHCYVNISFKAADMMQFKNENGEWVNLNGKVLGLDKDGDAAPSEKEYFLADKAEGQWAVSMTDAAGATAKNGVAATDSRKFTFTNRENGASFDVATIHALGNDVYAVEYHGSDPFGQYKIFGMQRYNRAERDTLVIAAAEGLNIDREGKLGNVYNDSYARWTKEELQDKTFQLSIDAAAEWFVV
ncbi:MAG: hypothetical protein LUJ25_03325 [Firmicutes bacterium]|nr:hypothetical protein [Bacillota bacterium]